MKSPLLRLASSLTLLAALAVATLGPVPSLAAPERGLTRAAAPASNEDPSGARVIVKFRAHSGLVQALAASTVHAPGPQAASVLAQRFGLALRDGRVVDRRSQVVFGDKSLSSAALAARLAADPDVEYAVPDYRRHALAVPNDPLYAASATTSPPAGQWYLRAPTSTLVSAIDAEGAWSFTTGSASVVVGDLDTGVRFDHTDLATKLLPGYDFITDLCIAGDGDGRDADASDPGDWITANQCNTTDPAQDSSWHGTQTASILGAATNNGIGMASVGYDSLVLPVRVLGKTGGYDSDIIAGMLWAAGLSSNPTANPHPARVLNLSFGSPSSTNSCTAYTDAISQLSASGVVVVAAAGNEIGLPVDTPANCPGVIAVAGLRHTGTKVGYSNIGPEVAIAAPAGNCVNDTGPCVYPIITATNSGTTTPALNTYTNGTNYAVGTSFSTPMVAGAAALMLAANPALTSAQVKSLLQSTARPFPTQPPGSTVPVCPSMTTSGECYCTTSTCGAGMLDVRAAVQAAAAAGTTPVATIAASTAMPLVGTTVTLDGSRSVGSGLIYDWAITSGGAIATLTSSSTASRVAVQFSAPGIAQIRLRVTDGTGASAIAQVTLGTVQPPSAAITASPAAPVAGGSVTLDGSTSSVDRSAGLTISRYQWAITSGNAIAALSGATDGSTATVTTSAAGSFTVQLTVTDSAGQVTSTTSTVTVAAAAPVSSSGGGAMSLAWLGALMLAVVALRWPAPRVSAPRRARTGR